MSREARGVLRAPRHYHGVLSAQLCAVLWLGVVAGRAANPNSGLTVDPAEDIQVWARVGEPVTPNAFAFGVTNTGRGRLRWAVSAQEDWIEVSPKGGVLLPRQGIRVLARIQDTVSLGVGVHVAHLSFANRSGGASLELRRIRLRVRLAAPAMLEEPLYTGRGSNTVAWLPVPGANEYQVQASASPDFGDPISSGWLVRATNHTFEGLQHAVTYSYRVVCRSNLTVWSQTLAGQFAANDNVGVSARHRPGEVILAGDTNRIWFEDFEEPGSSWTNTLFNDLRLASPPWLFEKGPQGKATFAPEAHPELPINVGGDQEGRLHAAQAFTRYAYATNLPQHRLQEVTVDAYLALAPVSPPGHLEGGVLLSGDPDAGNTGFLGGNALFAVVSAWFDGMSLNIDYVQHGIRFHAFIFPTIGFSRVAPGEIYHLRFQAVDWTATASLWQVWAADEVIYETPVTLGNGTNRLSIPAFSDGVVGLGGMAWSLVEGVDSGVFFDDVTILAHDGPATYTKAGRTTAIVEPPNWFAEWGRLEFHTQTQDPANSLTVDVLDNRGAVLAANLPSGTELSGLPAVAASRRLRLRANLSTTEPTMTPSLADWTVHWVLPAENASESEWSPPVKSTQDFVRPVVNITGPTQDLAVLTSVPFTLAGTAFDADSGVGGVRLFTHQATSTNGFTNWLLTVPSTLFLTPGTNVLPVVVRDRAIPANLVTQVQRIIFLPSAPQAALLAEQEQRVRFLQDGRSGLNILEPERAGPPILRIDYLKPDVWISWTPALPGWTLQSASRLRPPDWREATEAAEALVVVPADGGQRFFRLKAP